MSEGYIKFECRQISENKPSIDEIEDINKLRKYLYIMGLVGAMPDGIGFGNVSFKSFRGKMIISCSKTGALSDLSNEHYATIEEFDISKNRVAYSGSLPPSSETMTHIAIFEANTNIKTVAHIHNEAMWQRLISNSLNTSGNADYGTVEIAIESYHFAFNSKSACGIFALSGHKDGVVVYAENFDKIIKLLNEYI